MNTREIGIFLLGAVAGVAASWKLSQKQWQKFADADISSVKKVYTVTINDWKKKFADYREKVVAKYGAAVDKDFASAGMLDVDMTSINPSSVTNVKMDKPRNDMPRYEQIIKECRYSSEQPKTDYSKSKVDDRPIKDLPYIIKEECFGEMEQYTEQNLCYDIDISANERRLYHETTDNDVDVECTLGKDVLEYIDNNLEFEMDDGTETATIFVRDDVMKTDYKIVITRW